MTPAVEVRDLVKRYPKRNVNAVDGLSFSVAPGEIFGLLGPNGAGKSTTIGVLTTRVKATSGAATVAGVDVLRDPVAARRTLAVVPQRSNLDRSLTPRQNLVFHAAYHGVPAAVRKARAADLLDQFGLADRADDKIEAYSGGMVQRVMIARALMHAPRVLFLDEPTAGLDPQSRLFMWDRVRELQAASVTILLTTHDMDEAAEMSDRVGIVDHGRLLALDTPASLTHALAGQSVLDLTVVPSPTDDVDAVLAALGAVEGVDRVERVATGPVLSAGGLPGFPPGGAANGYGPPPGTPPSGGIDVRVYLDGEPAALLAPIVLVLDQRKTQLSDVHIGQPSLEDVFIDLTGRALR